MLSRRWLRWLLVVAFWTFLGFFFASQAGLGYMYTQGYAPWGLLIKLNLAEWYAWALLTPPIVWLSRRFPLASGRWYWSLLVLLPVSLIVVALKLAADGLVRHHLFGLPPAPIRPSSVHPNFLTFWAIVGAAHAFAYYQKYRERELRASQLEARLAEARLEVLKMQLHPHFLFNTLHTISALVHEDPEAADRMIAALSDLLRLALSNVGAQEVSLRQEMEFLDHYIEIQQMRFGERLEVRTEIGPEALDAGVPNLLLQPLVENAIRHGIAPRSAPGRIEISARRQGERLVIEISDDGPGLPAGFQEGIGIANTRARLEHLFNAAHRFELVSGAGGGVRVVIEIPFRPAPENGPAAEADSGTTGGEA